MVIMETVVHLAENVALQDLTPHPNYQRRKRDRQEVKKCPRVRI